MAGVGSGQEQTAPRLSRSILGKLTRPSDSEPPLPSPLKTSWQPGATKKYKCFKQTGWTIGRVREIVTREMFSVQKKYEQ